TLIAWRPASSTDASFTARRRTGMQTLSSVVPAHMQERLASEPVKDAFRRVDSFPLLSTLADKALALGRPEDAERILASLLSEILKRLESDNSFAPETVDQAAQYGVRLAAGTGKGSWVDYVVALYTAV